MQRINGPELKIKLDKDLVVELDRISKRLELSRNQTIRNFLDVALDVFHGYEKVGIWKLLEIKRRIGRNIKEDTQPKLFKG